MKTLDDHGTQKEKLANLIKELGESLNPDEARKINYEQLERISRRLISFSDECMECQEYISWIIMCMENANELRGFQNKQELSNYHSNLKAIVSHMQDKHKLIVEGQYMSMLMSVGLAIGAGLGSAFNNIAIGISMGLCIGLAVGAGIDAVFKKRDLYYSSLVP